MKGVLKPIHIACGVAFVICAAGVLVLQFGDPSDTDVRPALGKKPPTPIELPSSSNVDDSPKQQVAAQATPPAEAEVDPGERWKTAHIEEFKQALYEREIESVEDLHLLDEFVQIGDADTRDFWNTDWSGVDDWKRNQDGFSLEKLEDGTLVFVPGQETKQIYSFFETMNVYDYDEATQEFVHETSYYGKPIVNIVKFLRDDVMVLMIVSGSKVDMNIYELDGDRRD